MSKLESLLYIFGLRSDGTEVFRFTNPVNTPINPYDSKRACSNRSSCRSENRRVLPACVLSKGAGFFSSR